MFLKAFQLLFRHTLNSVPFGIALMVLSGLYIAVGSGLPKVRAYFELTDLEFFNAWPLKLLMALLVATLSVVTWTRIPFTPPRYGVWCIHAGIITLIYGTAIYYHNKVEGLTLVPLKQTVEHYYDGTERSLHLRADGVPLASHPLPSLPRFHEYSPRSGNEQNLSGRDLRGIEPFIELQDRASGRPIRRPLHEQMKLPNPLRLDIIGYYPYATVQSDFVEDPVSGEIGVRLTMQDQHTGRLGDEWLAASDPRGGSSIMGEVEFEHRHVDAAALQALEHAAGQLHRLDIRIAETFADTTFVEPGKTYPIGERYSLAIEEFNPAWPMFGTNEIVKALTMKITRDSDGKVFRRMVLDGKPVQTDFELDVEGAGPMGKRQKEPLDNDLVILYRFSDPHKLLPRQGGRKHTFVSSDINGGLMMISTALKSAAEVTQLPQGRGEIPLEAHGDETTLSVQRSDRVRRIDKIEPVPPALRQRTAGEMGVFQVLLVRASMGDWSKEVAVPFSQWAGEVRWEGGSVVLPQGNVTLQMQLGQTRRPLPARVTLERFDLVTYPGGHVNSGVYRDFKSTLTIEDWRSGDKRTAVAHLNNPVYFGGIGDSYWTFFQAQWDPQGQRWTVLGVGNRPGVWIMTVGCVMIVLGILYAFYVKPVIIRRMKQRALSQASNRSRQPELVST